MLDNPNQTPPTPTNAVSHYEHDDGSLCLYRPYWIGNNRDGHWAFAYWYMDDSRTWRYCGVHN